MTRLEVGAVAPDAVVFDAGREIRLSETWRDGPVVLAFLRHFG